jgi:hypothetical protein
MHVSALVVHPQVSVRFVAFEVPIAAHMNASIFWGARRRSPFANRRFAGMNFASPSTARWFLARLIFDPEDGADGSHTDYAALHPRKWQLPALHLLKLSRCINS